ncbi:MAG: UDP-N-acetylmuramate dehydrogenase [Nannocystaceae bacterium]
MSRGQALLDALGDAAAGDDLELAADEPMARHTTLRLGGPADLWARPRSLAALQRLLARASARSIPTTFVGSGTNLLVRDGGLRGIVINLGHLSEVTRADPDGAPGEVEVLAGASTGKLLKASLEWELGGLEFLGGVPGSVGGGLVMNAGTYLGEFTSVVTEVRSIRRDGDLVRRDHDACGFRYRASDLPRDEVVIGASLRLWPRPRAEIEADVAGLRARRKAREPVGVANSGSTFKNPPGDFAGRLIEAAGLKGTREGGALVSPVHANWLVVERGLPCRSADLLALIERVRATVLEVHGVALETEVKILGEPE